ncbi:murein L,D-transpeptidase catalytic domain family protein [Fibrella forsythiae]|uniref:Murein L,D-transpeptidase catalytic domain family protein n=1 Tax=Fibrella forsythiae TaxID=2817061 RepID=A0ABS3JDN1_9BACT|nr:murein L,D-transpeptidase catalytic domain family protein [Fibrella forsythiae]MBO0948111.1 murein L,D-transpeptidase catalytic domain family protein [Fibrella forsythiae]
MKQALIAVFSLLSIAITGSEKFTAPAEIHREITPTVAPAPSTFQMLYDELNLASSGLSREAYLIALRGMLQISGAKPLLSIVDMSQPSSKKRLYVIDLVKRKLLFNTYVAHGRNSGELLPKRFSNTNSSFQSSLGFYKTLGLYQGKHGLSMQLQGLEKGINDNAFSRAIVMHGADYVCEEVIRRTGRLGRSQGCPAVSTAECSPIVRTIAGGSCLFVYYPDDTYLKKSVFLKS